MSYIHNIEITNFKSIRHQKIDGCKRINVFIGYPNVGKSNLLEALSLFSINSEKDDLSSFVRLADFTTLFFDGNLSDEAVINLNYNHRFVVNAEQNELSFSEQIEKDASEMYHEDEHVGRAMGHMTLAGKSFKIRKEKDGTSNFGAHSLDNRNLSLDIKRYDFQKNMNYSGEEYFHLSIPNGSNLFRILSSNSTIRQEVAELFKPYNLELLYDTRLQIFTILKRTETGIFSIPYNLIADTLQRVIFYKAAILSNKNSVLLFEEPEAHMFPPYVRKVTADILLDENSNQYFITTHSPYILTEFIEDADARNDLAVYVVDYTNGETVIKKMSDEELTEVAQYGIDLFYNLESYLERYGQPNSA